MALPVPKTEPEPEDVERIFRPVRGADGELRIVDLPATLRNLLNLGPEDQVTQSNDHLLTLVPLFDALKRYLERLAPNLAVFSDLQLLYKRHRASGERLLTSEQEEAARRAAETAHQRAETEREMEKAARRMAEAERRKAEAARQAAERRVGEADARARETLLELLDARGLTPSEEVRRRVLACRDPEQLMRWTLRGATIETLDDLFDDEK